MTSLSDQFTEVELNHIWKEAKFMGVDLHEEEMLVSTIERLSKNEPYQYIFGRAYFYDFELNVSSDVLIPRPETEELVDLIAKDFMGLSPKIIDIGTGSGCIALALAKLLPKASVSALDVSPKALQIAAKNSEELSLPIKLIETNILSQKLDDTYDVIVSNPPYIPHVEKKLMEENVLKYEPHLALFVEDESALIFYEEIANQALNCLKINGGLYFECNEFNADAVKNMLIKKGFNRVEVLLDMQDKKRMIKAQLSK